MTDPFLPHPAVPVGTHPPLSTARPGRTPCQRVRLLSDQHIYLQFWRAEEDRFIRVLHERFHSLPEDARARLYEVISAPDGPGELTLEIVDDGLAPYRFTGADILFDRQLEFGCLRFWAPVLDLMPDSVLSTVIACGLARLLVEDEFRCRVRDGEARETWTSNSAESEQASQASAMVLAWGCDALAWLSWIWCNQRILAKMNRTLSRRRRRGTR